MIAHSLWSKGAMVLANFGKDTGDRNCISKK